MSVLFALALAACDAPLEAPVTAEPVAPAAAAPDTEPRANKETKSLPAPPASTLETTTIAGYGVALDLRPPFQAMRARIAEVDDHLILTWWDVTVAGAGGHVARGIYSVAIVPGSQALPEAEFTRVSSDSTHMPVLFRLGDDGTEVRLEAPIEDLAQIGAELKRGPNTTGWSVDGAADEAWPRHHLLQSADPATGHTYEILQQPSRPWGPWPADPTPAQPQ